MDTPLLSKMVKELILENDAVTLPGIGTFVAELVGASFSDKGYTINPPYRRLSFTQREGSDTLLADIYASSNDVPYESALQILTEFLASLKAELMTKKSVQFPGLGRLRATRENNFFFIADEDLDIYPDGFGLEPISLKTHEETEEEVSAAVAGLAAMLEEKDSTDKSWNDEKGQTGHDGKEVATEEKAEEPAEPVEEEKAPEQPVAVTKEDIQAMVAEQVKQMMAGEEISRQARNDSKAKAKKPMRKGLKITLWVLLILVILAALLLGAFFLAAHFAPDWLDTLLYTPEELEILHS